MTPLLGRLRIASLLGVCISSLPGCADRTAATTEPSANAAPAEISVVDPAAMRVVARSLARALSDPMLRRYVGRSMRVSRSDEHKLWVSDFLLRPESRSLVAELALHSARTPDQFLTLLRTLPDLQLFVPVKTHRRTWNGTGDVYVAGLLDRTTFVAYDTSGRVRALSNDVAPSNATFVLMQSERKRLSPSQVSVQANSAANQVSLDEGTGCSEYAIIECDSGPTGGGAPPVAGAPVVGATAPSGTYIVHTEIFDVGEPWIRGHPEIEIHLIGPNANSPNDYDVTTQRCFFHDEEAGAGGPTPNGVDVIDINDHFWDGAVRLLEPPAAPGSFWFGNPRRFQFQLWEDDTQDCVIRTNQNVIRRFFIDQAYLTGALTVFVVGTNLTPDRYQCPGGVCELMGGIFYLGTLLNLINVTTDSDDDPLGMLVPNSVAIAKGLTPVWGTTHTIVLPKSDGSYNSNGGVRLVNHVMGTATY